MLFIKSEELKPGMRLAKPIYSKKGVLLYDRAAVLKDMQAIENIKSFGLIGLFVLEPAEPVPPMTQDDLDFERFQTMMYHEIMEELEKNYGIYLKVDDFVQELKQKLKEVKSYKALYEYIGTDLGKDKTELEIIIQGYQKAKEKGYIKDPYEQVKINQARARDKRWGYKNGYGYGW